MATDSGYEKGNYLRVCDICGHRFHFRDLRPIGEMRFACPDDAPGLTSMQISRWNARAKPLVVRPNRFAKDYAQTGIYQLAEAQIFNFVAQVAPKGEQDGANSAEAAGWAVAYLADILAQAKRPRNWDRTATTAINACCAYLLTLQYGSPTGPTPSGTADNPRYGGIQVSSDWNTAATVAAGLAFIKAYSALGTAAYLQAAERVATFIRHAQSGNLQATAYTVYPAGGGAYHVGGLAKSVHDSTGLLDIEYRVADIAGAWFLRLLAGVKGGSTTYGDTTATAFFGANGATLATMIAELTAFGETGVRDSASSGALVTGLSATIPATSYMAATNGGTGAGAWVAADNVATSDLALAIAGIYQANGNTAKVTEMLAWLAAFTSNTANRTPADLTEEEVFQGITGTYDPTLCPANQLVTAAPFTESDGALYDWASLGLLAPILAADQTAFRRSKDTLSTSVRYTTLDVKNVYLGPIGSSGLSLQPWYRGQYGQLVPATGSSTGGGGGSAVMPGLIFYGKAGVGVSSSGGVATAWADQSGYGQHVTDLALNPGPFVGLDTLNGVPGFTFQLDRVISRGLYRPAGLRDRNGVPMGYGTGETQARTVIAVIKPKYAAAVFGITGGLVVEMGSTPTFQPIFDLEDNVHTNGFYVFSTGWRNPGGGALQGPDTAGGSGGVYDGVVLMAEWSSTGFSNISFRINGVEVAVTPAAIPGATGPTINPPFSIGRASSGGDHFYGVMGDVFVFDHAIDDAERAQVATLVASRFSLPLTNYVPSVVRAARAGLAYRQNPGRYPFLRGN